MFSQVHIARIPGILDPQALHTVQFSWLFLGGPKSKEASATIGFYQNSSGEAVLLWSMWLKAEKCWVRLESLGVQGFGL